EIGGALDVTPDQSPCWVARGGGGPLSPFKTRTTEKRTVRRIGLDLALQAPHRAAIFDDGDAVGSSFAVARSKTGIDDLIRRATAGHDGPCEFIMEPTGFAWVPLAAEIVRRGH